MTRTERDDSDWAHHGGVLAVLHVVELQVQVVEQRAQVRHLIYYIFILYYIILYNILNSIFDAGR